jgi:hypothetical protein
MNSSSMDNPETRLIVYGSLAPGGAMGCLIPVLLALIIVAGFLVVIR